MTTLTDIRRYIFLVIFLIINVLSAISQEMYMNVFTITEQPCGDKPMHLKLDLFADYQGDTKAVVALSVNDGKKNIYWGGFPLKRDFSLEMNIPSYLLRYGPLKCTVFNPNKDQIRLDSVNYSFDETNLPSFVPENIDVMQPISLYLNGNQYFDWQRIETDYSTVTLLNENDFARTQIDIFSAVDDPNVRYEITAEFRKDLEISRFAVLMPFADGEFTVYRSNLHVDTVACQDEYYLDHEGFSYRKGEKQINLYHPKSLSSIQLDVKSSAAILNIDYELDHPMIHYPARHNTVEYYENISKRQVISGEKM